MRRGKAADALLTRKALAAVLSLHPQTLVRHVANGMPVARKGRRGYLYDPAAVRQWLAAREAAARTSGPLDPIRERARRDRWTAELARQTFRARMRHLLPAEEVTQHVGARFAAARRKFLSVPTTYADRINQAAAQGLPGVEAALKRMVREVLTALAEMPPPKPVMPPGNGRR